MDYLELENKKVWTVCSCGHQFVVYESEVAFGKVVKCWRCENVNKTK